jgi:hypothetical protein
MGLALALQVELLPGGEYLRCDGGAESAARGARPQVGASYARGFKRCVLPLRGDTDGPAEYTVRLRFPLLEDRQAKNVSFDIKLQGDIVAKAFSPAQAAENTERPAYLEFSGVRVDRNLELELICSGDATSQESAPVLSGLEILCTSRKTQTDAKQVALR